MLCVSYFLNCLQFKGGLLVDFFHSIKPVLSLRKGFSLETRSVKTSRVKGTLSTRFPHLSFKRISEESLLPHTFQISLSLPRRVPFTVKHVHSCRQRTFTSKGNYSLQRTEHLIVILKVSLLHRVSHSVVSSSCWLSVQTFHLQRVECIFAGVKCSLTL